MNTYSNDDWPLSLAYLFILGASSASGIKWVKAAHLSGLL